MYVPEYNFFLNTDHVWNLTNTYFNILPLILSYYILYSN